MPNPDRILILNGPNLNLLGTREPEIYGRRTLTEIGAACAERAGALGLTVEMRQSNGEGDIVGWIQEAPGGFAGIIINPAAYTHTSVAIPDALRFTGLPVIEVHLSNIFTREPYRHHSYVSPAAVGVICGLGGEGYVLAVEAMAGLIKQGKKS